MTFSTQTHTFIYLFIFVGITISWHCSCRVGKMNCREMQLIKITITIEATEETKIEATAIKTTQLRIEQKLNEMMK